MQSHEWKSCIPTRSPSFKVPVWESLAWSMSRRTWSLPSHLIYGKKSTIEVFPLVFDLLRRSDTKADLAFPIPDNAVRDYLMSVSEDLPTKYLTFLGSVFRLINCELDFCQEDWKQIPTAPGLAKWWSSHLEDIRSKLYKEAIDSTAEPIPVRIREDGEKYHC